MQQNIDITPAIKDWYGKNFRSVRGGISDAVTGYMHALENHPAPAMFRDLDTAHDYMLQSWRYMWRHTLSALKGRFTENELKLLIDIHNGHAVTAQTYGMGVVYIQARDAMGLDGMAEKWEIDRETLLKKLESLTPIEDMVIELWANGFWYGRNQAKGLEDYVKLLAAEEKVDGL